MAGDLHIDCGTTSGYTEPATTLNWVPDTDYITSGVNFGVVPGYDGSYPEFATLRYFDDHRAKNCYSLPVIFNATYMLRAGWYYGGYDNALQPPTFQLGIDAAVVA